MLKWIKIKYKWLSSYKTIINKYKNNNNYFKILKYYKKEMIKR